MMSGGKIQSRPVLHSGKHVPKAVRNRDGSLTLLVSYETTQNSTMGPLFKGGTKLKTEQRVFIADPSNAQSARHVIRKRFPHYDEPMLSTMFTDTRSITGIASQGESLKFSHGWPVNGSQLVCPSEECIIYDKNFMWYIPARGNNPEPMIVVIPAPSDSHTPVKQLPLRLALLPIGILSDVGINTWVVVASATGQNIDL